jgi:hypothetical protein
MLSEPGTIRPTLFIEVYNQNFKKEKTIKIPGQVKLWSLIGLNNEIIVETFIKREEIRYIWKVNLNNSEIHKLKV